MIAKLYAEKLKAKEAAALQDTPSKSVPQLVQATKEAKQASDLRARNRLRPVKATARPRESQDVGAVRVGGRKVDRHRSPDTAAKEGRHGGEPDQLVPQCASHIPRGRNRP